MFTRYEMKQMYEKGMSIKEIARHFDCYPGSVEDVLQVLKVKMREMGTNQYTIR